MKTYEELIRFLSDEEVSHADKMETLQNRDHLLNSEWQARIDEARSGRDAWIEAERQARRMAYERCADHLARVIPFGGQNRAQLREVEAVFRVWAATL